MLDVDYYSIVIIMGGTSGGLSYESMMQNTSNLYLTLFSRRILICLI
jgi:hypothetical protein